MSLGRKRLAEAAAIAAVLVLALPAEAYYQYIHFSGGNFAAPLYEKFDLNALPGKTVTFSVVDQSNLAYAPNDSQASVLSQVKEAIAAWNTPPYSDLRLRFGGLKAQGQTGFNTPAGDVTFIDLPPGVLGMGGPITSLTPSNGFYPILHSTVMLSRDTTQGAGPSYLEEFFTTAVHEIGHGLGLQHTWTGSAMSQGVIRNTSRIRPLDADDIAGLSVLYGKPGWSASYGSISGRVTFTNGNPVSLASVVAIAPNGPAVSALTNPDGTYRIDGLPPNLNYLVYAHPLPPDAVASGESLRLPVDQDGVPFQASGAFQTVFYRAGGTTLDPQQALPVAPGSASINFAVVSRAAPATYNVVTYSRLDSAKRNYVTTNGDTWVTPAFINTTQSVSFVDITAQAPAALPDPQSLTVSILGGFAPAAWNPGGMVAPVIWPSTADAGHIWAFFTPPLIGAGIGPRHMVFNFGNDVYVLPGGVNLVQKGPPVVTAVTPGADGTTVTITGAGLAPDTSIYFDGIKAAIVGQFSGSDAQGSITVAPPAGAAPLVAAISVYNSDGQSSMLLQSQNPFTYSYPPALSPQITNITVNSLPAGATAAIDIFASNVNFVDGQVALGLGSDDVTVRRVWVQGPNHLTANVVVAPNAALGASELSILSGLQVIAQPAQFLTLPARSGLPVINLPVANADPTQSMIFAGSQATITGQNLAPASGNPSITVNDVPVQVVSASPTQVTFVVPAPLPSGPVVLKLNNGTASAYPVAMQIDVPPAVILGVTTLSGQSLLGGSVGLGDTLNVTVAGLDPAVLNNLGRVQVVVSGVPMQVLQIVQTPNGQFQIQITITQGFGGSQVPLAVVVDGSASLPVIITVR
jgi:uncharacterized protein (TIGR03437 family)